MVETVVKPYGCDCMITLVVKMYTSNHCMQHKLQLVKIIPLW